MEIPEKLSAENFLAICDVAMDLKEEMQMSSENSISIPIVRQTIIRFPILLPAVTPNHMDKYYANRIKAVKYLKEAGAIKEFKLYKDITWDGTMEIIIDRAEFDKYYHKLEEVYEKRVVEPERKKIKAGNSGAPKFRLSQGVLFRDFCNDIIIFKDENGQDFRVVKATMGLPVNERIDALTDDLDLTFRQLYDTARRINGKVKAIFGIDNFFETDWTNKVIKRVVE